MFTFKKIALVGVAAIAALSMSCSETDEPGTDPSLNWDNFNLGTKSYGDIDAAKIYSQGELTDAIKEDIDVVAFYADALNDKVVYNPCIVPTIGPNDCGDPELYDIPSQYQAAIKSAETVSDLSDFINDLDNVTGEDGEGTVTGGGAKEKSDITIADGKAFLVFSTKLRFYVVVMGGDGSTRSVALNFAETTGR
jgi:hypothetical protein